jgi:hypothetical protein
VDERKLILKWNLVRLADELAEHLEGLERSDNLWDTSMQSEEFLEPYNLSEDDYDTVIGLAWKVGCIDCGRLWDHYMVRDEVWREAGLEQEDYCCRPCLSLRLKRGLRPGDFTDAPINWPDAAGRPLAEVSPARAAAVEEWRRRRGPR